MEPICYLMTFGNFTFGYFFYLVYKKDTEFQNLRELITEREVTRVYTQAKLDEHEADKQKIERLRKELKVIF